MEDSREGSLELNLWPGVCVHRSGVKKKDIKGRSAKKRVERIKTGNCNDWMEEKTGHARGRPKNAKRPLFCLFAHS